MSKNKNADPVEGLLKAQGVPKPLRKYMMEKLGPDPSVQAIAREVETARSTGFLDHARAVRDAQKAEKKAAAAAVAPPPTPAAAPPPPSRLDQWRSLIAVNPYLAASRFMAAPDAVKDMAAAIEQKNAPAIQPVEMPPQPNRYLQMQAIQNPIERAAFLQRNEMMVHRDLIALKQTERDEKHAIHQRAAELLLTPPPDDKK